MVSRTVRFFGSSSTSKMLTGSSLSSTIASLTAGRSLEVGGGSCLEFIAVFLRWGSFISPPERRPTRVRDACNIEMDDNRAPPAYGTLASRSKLGFGTPRDSSFEKGTLVGRGKKGGGRQDARPKTHRTARRIGKFEDRGKTCRPPLPAQTA